MTRSIVAKDTVADAVEDHRKAEGKQPEINKAKDYVGFIVSALPLIGAIGTVFVWICSAVYVGSVELTSQKPFRTIFVQVYNERGNESTFYSPRFQLMPGDYVLRVTLDKDLPTQCGAIVKFHEKTTIPLEQPKALTIQDESPSDDQVTPQNPKKHWWQFWRK
jgi:hypothetical protein